MILTRYILKEHIAPFLYAFGVVTFLFVMDFVLEMIDSIFSKGLNVFTVLEIFILNLGWIVALSVPMAVLVASLMAYGRLSADNEIIVLKSAGVHTVKIILPAFLASMVVAAGLIYFNNHILPEANHRAAMMYLDIARKRPAAFIREGFIIDDFKGYRIIVDRVDPLSGDMVGIKIYQEEQGSTSLTFARRGRIDYINRGILIRFTLLDGESHKENVDKPGDYFRSEFRKQVVYIDNVDDTFKRSSEKERGDREMSSAMMLERVRGYEAQRSREQRQLTEQAAAARKTTLPEARPVPPGAAFDFGRIAVPLFDRVLSEERRKERDLQRRRGFLESLDQSIGKYMVEVHKKYSIPAACPTLVLVGAPLGIMARASGIGMGVAYSLAFFILYWIFLIGGESLADRLIIPAWAAMWSPNILLTGVGVWLIVSLVRERTFAWFAWITRGIQWLERKLRLRKDGG